MIQSTSDKSHFLKRVQRWFRGTSRRTFIVIPALLIAAELGLNGGALAFVPWGIPLMAWGCVQCRMSAKYRNRLGGGGPGRNVPPHSIVDTGIYRFVRNPMYLGNMIFLAGLAICLWSWIGLLVLIGHMVWYELRVREDEEKLAEIFGGIYGDYLAATKRWIPFLY
jgi:protein-S-isoprenylcysteine O-methyltransferase Ste14